jgi:formate dehydrogenase iron-sulfur subunit
VYGIEEVGGTSILYLTSVPFEQLGFKTQLQSNALPMLTWNVLSKIPNVVSIGGVTLFGIWWITNRRMEIQRERKNGSETRPGQPADNNHSPTINS